VETNGFTANSGGPRRLVRSYPIGDEPIITGIFFDFRPNNVVRMPRGFFNSVTAD